MKRLVSALLLFVLLLTITAGTAAISINRVSSYAQAENQEKLALVQQRLDETLLLLNTLSQDDYICSPDVSYQEKAAFLTAKNKNENLGYMMLRILDSEINIYREDVGLASNLGSRDYMQKMYATGEHQVTDAFLAGADGKTINYTLTAAIQEDGKVVGALMAAIYGTEMDGYLQDDVSQNVLVGSQLQFMGGISEEQFGLDVAQVLEGEHNTSRPVENILLDFYEEKPGSFWGIGDGIHYFVYSPVEHCDWVVVTKVPVLPLVQHILVAYVAVVLALLLVGVLLCKRLCK